LENFRTVFTVKVVLFNIVFREPGWGGVGRATATRTTWYFRLNMN
jgi:hypothetical protein